ncbi:unnamed protein product [Calypogeia fissa]
MIGQQKRLLEHSASSKPVKYQKHSDDKLGDAHTRVASFTDEKKIEFEHHFSGVSQKNAFSVSPGANSESMKVFERVLASEIKQTSQKDKDTSELETGVCCGSHDNCPSAAQLDVVRVADDPCSHSAKELTVEAFGEDVGYSSDKGNETQGGGTLETHQLIRAAEFSPPGGLGALSEENARNNWSPLGSPARDLHVQLFGDEEEIGLIEDDEDVRLPSTAEHSLEGDPFHATAQGTRRSPSTTPFSQSLPVLLNDKVIDLYALDEKVESYAGYETVNSEGLWGNISEALGLGSHCGPGVKLIYFKHLRRLERDRGLLLERHHDSHLIDAVNIRRPALSTENRLLDDKGEDYSLTDSEQFAESDPFLEKAVEHPVNGRRSHVSRCLGVDNSDDETEMGSVEREPAKLYSPYGTSGYPFIGNCSFSQECQDFPEALHSDDGLFKSYIDHHGPGPSKEKRELGTNVEEQVVYDVTTIERFKKSLADTLTWIKRMAVEPGNPRMGQGTEGTGQDETWARKCASQAQKVRTALWRQKDDIRQGDGHSHPVKQQLPPPSQYYEDSTRQEHRAPDRPRPTRERAAHHGSTSAQKPFNDSVNNQIGSSPSFHQQPQWACQTSQRLSRQNHHYYSEERCPEELLDIPKNRKRVPIGEDFQADIPCFMSVDRHPSSVGTGGIAGPSGDETQSSDGNDEEDHSRWLGKQVWPPPGGKRVAYNDHYLGRRRPSFCSCLNPESINCVRLHIEEERDRLKDELGQAFYIWRFDQMGASVAAEWTKDEQHTYQTLVQLNPPSRGKNFWDQLPEAFPGKSMKELVSFYFNVFVLRRRAIQNRLDSQHIDSDDDETNYPEFDSEDSEDDYESGDEGDEEDDPDASEDEEETDKEDGPYGRDSPAKLLEDTGFCDLEGYSSKIGVTSPLHEAQDVSMTVRTARLMNLGDVEQGYHHDPHQEEIDVRLGTAHMTTKWSQDEHEDEKHLEEEQHISVVGEEELQEVKTWEASHWDEADHDDLGHDPLAKGVSSKDDQTQEKDLYKKAVEGTNQHTSLVGPCEGEVWGPTMDIPQINKREKLLSTNGMIQEFFGNGNEASGLNASS